MKSNKTTKQIRATAKQAVAEVLAVEEAPKQKEKMEELVEGYQTELSDLNDAKAAVEDENKNLSAENEALRGEKKELEDKIATLEKELSDLKKEKETLEQAKKDLETQLSDMEQDIASQKRLRELEEAGITTLSDKMKSRIKKMDEEEFAEYKSEFITLKAEIEKKATVETGATKYECDECGATFSSSSDKPKCPKCGSTDVSAADDSSHASNAEVIDDDLELESPKATAAQLLKLKKQIMASLNVASTGGDHDLPEDMKKDLASMWDDEKEEK